MDARTPAPHGMPPLGALTDSSLPATYGDVLNPLRVATLPSPLADLHRDSALFRAWLHAWDRALRAEKVSSWTTWTLAERRAWDADDIVAFSRLRGYSESEIADYLEYLELTRRLDAEHADDPDFTFCAMQDVLQTMRTAAFDALEACLLALSDGPPPRLQP